MIDNMKRKMKSRMVIWIIMIVLIITDFWIKEPIFYVFFWIGEMLLSLGMNDALFMMVIECNDILYYVLKYFICVVN